MTRRTLKSAASLAWIAALSACGRAPAPLPPSPPRPVLAAPAPSAPAPAATPEITTAALVAPPAPLPPWIQRIADPACSWTTERWNRRVVTQLRLRPGGPVFARVNGGKAQVHIPAGKASHGLLDVGANGLVVS